MRRLTVPSACLFGPLGGRMVPPRVLCSPLVAPRIPPPQGPSCSRWISCSCCRNNDERTATHTTLHPRFSVEQTPFDTGRNMTTPHLPLPPTLPYSPHSQPFIRHLQILSLSLLSSSADESWDVYSALHTDLRHAIPDEVFASLVAHQLQGSAAKKWPRLISLFNLAQSCDMDPAAFGKNIIEGALLNALRTVQGGGVSLSIDMLNWLWNCLCRLHCQSLCNVPVEIRKRWIRLIVRRSRLTSITEARLAIEEFIDLGGGIGLEVKVRELVINDKGNAPHIHEASLRFAAWCLTKNVNVHCRDLITLLDRLQVTWNLLNKNGLEQARLLGETLIKDLETSGHPNAARVLRAALLDLQLARRTPYEKGTDIVRDSSSSVPQLHRAAQRILKLAKTAVDDMTMTVELCEQALQDNEADYEALLRITVRRLDRPPINTPLTVRLARSILAAGVFDSHALSPPLMSRILRLVIDSLPAEDAYRLAYKIYPYTRAATPPHQWVPTNSWRWQALFSKALCNGHINFASRLYTDFQADGQAIDRTDALQFIRAIGRTKNASRSILLDRHVKDYIWLDLGSTDQLVIALADGLSQGGYNDALLALQMARRIQDTPLPPRAIEFIVKALSQSPHAEHLSIRDSLLKELPRSLEAAPSFDAALAHAVLHVKERGLEPCLSLYREMATRAIQPTSYTASLLIRALVDSGDCGIALDIFKAAFNAGLNVKSNAVGRLMISLAIHGRTGEAYDVERLWRARGPTYDRGIRGARLFVDLKAGKSVDLTKCHLRHRDEVILKKSKKKSWKPNQNFYRFLESIQVDSLLSTEKQATKLRVSEM